MEWYAIAGIIAAYLLIGSIIAIELDRHTSLGWEPIELGMVTLFWPVAVPFIFIWAVGKLVAWVSYKIETKRYEDREWRRHEELQKAKEKHVA